MFDHQYHHHTWRHFWRTSSITEKTSLDQTTGLWTGIGGRNYTRFRGNTLDRHHFWLNIIITYQHHFWRRIYHFEKPTISSCPTTFLKTTVTDGAAPINLIKKQDHTRTHRNSWIPTESTPKHYLKTNGTRRILTKLIKTFSMKTLPTQNITRQPTEPAKTNGAHRNPIRTHGNLTNPPELIEANSIHTKPILENKQNLPVQRTSSLLGPRALDRQWRSDL